MAANVIEKLQEAVKAFEEISAKEFNSQDKEIIKQFGKIEKLIREFVDGNRILRNNPNWIMKEVKCSEKGKYNEVIDAEAERISKCTRWPKTVIKDLLTLENQNRARWECSWPQSVYVIWTIDV